MEAKIKMHNNRPTIFIDKIPYCPSIYALTDCPGGRLSYEEIPNYNIKKFVNAGLKMYQLDIWFEDMWFEDGTFDITIAKKQIDGITKLDKKAAIFFRFHTTPPKWWHEKYPEECTKYADIKTTKEKQLHVFDRYLIQDLQPVLRHSFASLKWYKDASKMLIKFIEQFQQCEQSNNLVGIQVATGIYGENHYWAFMQHEPDTSKPMTDVYRKYINNPKAHVPDMAERYNLSDEIFRDPKKEANMIDYTTCQHELVAKSIVHFCKVIKDNWKGEIITGAFYCYYVSLFGRAATGGHLAEEIVLNSPYIDYISAPQAYNKNLRNIGGAGVSRGLLASIALHEKLLLDEVDHPTHLGTIMGGMKVYPKYESHQILRRNILSSYIKGMGFWYYDFGQFNTSGWWNDPIYMDEITFLQKLMEKYYKKEYTSHSDVLLVFDTKVQKYVPNNANQDPLTDKACINISYPKALRSGASLDTIYLSDLEKVNLDKYKCIIFMNSFYLTTSQKTFIKENVYKNNRHIIWFVAPGYIDGNKNDIKNIEEISKFTIDKVAIDKTITVTSSDFEYSIDNSNEKSLLKNIFVPTDGNIVGKIGNNAGLSYKKYNDHTIWFSSIPFTDESAFRYIYNNSLVHIYNTKNDALLEGSNLLLIHSEFGGDRTINFINKKITITLKKGETVVFDSNSGNILKRG